jgi:hypothetical protein
MLLNRLIASPRPLQRRGFKTSEVKVLFFGEDLGEAMTNVIK